MFQARHINPTLTLSKPGTQHRRRLSYSFLYVFVRRKLSELISSSSCVWEISIFPFAGGLIVMSGWYWSFSIKTSSSCYTLFPRNFLDITITASGKKDPPSIDDINPRLYLESSSMTDHSPENDQNGRFIFINCSDQVSWLTSNCPRSRLITRINIFRLYIAAFEYYASALSTYINDSVLFN